MSNPEGDSDGNTIWPEYEDAARDGRLEDESDFHPVQSEGDQPSEPEE